MNQSPPHRSASPPRRTGSAGPAARTARRLAVVIALLLFALGFALCLWLDRWAYLNLRAQPRTIDRDWFRFFRAMGHVLPWLLAAAALLLHDLPQFVIRGWRGLIDRALWVIAVVAASGIAAELVKILVRRQRPEIADGLNTFRPWAEQTFKSSGLAFPSSHTMVAFGGAWALCFLFPRAWPVWISLGVGCAATRVAQGAHYLSDVYAAAGFSLLICLALRALWRPPARRDLLQP